MTPPIHIRENIIGIEVPEGNTWDIVIVDGKSYLAGDDDKGMMQLSNNPLPPGTWQIICLSGECTEGEAGDIAGLEGQDAVQEYNRDELKELLRSKGLDPERTLILKKQ